MIIREIKDEPETVLATFDWFNDYDDTKLWCKEMGLDEIVKSLDSGFKKWIKKFQQKKYEDNTRN